MLQLWFVLNTVGWPFNVKVGSSALTLNVVLLLISGPVWLWNKKRVTLSSVRQLGLFAGCLICSLAIAKLQATCSDGFPKAMLTGPTLVFLLFLGWEIGYVADGSQWRSLESAAKLALGIAFVSMIIEMLFPSAFPHQANYRVEDKLSGLFQEPSHVAFSLFPCVVVLLVSAKKKTRWIGFCALLGMLALSRSSTLIALAVLWGVYFTLAQRRLRTLLVSFAVAAVLIGAAASTNASQYLAPTVERIAGVASSSTTRNLSSLVYVQGWQDLVANLSRSHGLGLGFNMMGCHPLPDVAVRRIFLLAGGGGLNDEDGSFQFSKIVSEFGWIGVALYVYLIFFLVRLQKLIHAQRGNRASNALRKQAALIFCFVASSFVRSGSYFSGSLLLCIVAIASAVRFRRSLRQGLSAPRAAALANEPQPGSDGATACT